MVGMMLWEPAGYILRPVVLKEVSVLHVRLLRAGMTRSERMSDAALRRRMRSAGRKLLRQGVERVVLPVGAPADVLPEGLRPAGTLPLRPSRRGGLVRGAAAAPE